MIGNKCNIIFTVQPCVIKAKYDRIILYRLSAAHHVTSNPLRPNVIQTWAQEFDYCKMVRNVLGDVSVNMSSENENSEKQWMMIH